MDRQAHVLIVAASGRALAASARRGGYRPLVADYFGDQDTLALADAHCRLDDGLATGMRRDAVMRACENLARDRAPVGVVCGTGFEDRPALLDALAQRWPLIGNRPEVVARLKSPMDFADLCAGLDIPHPEIALALPDDADEWLMKRSGGAGGYHVTAVCAGGMPAPGRYFQRRVPGTPMSAMLLADGRHAVVLGFSAQWAAPTPAHPYRYGGAVTPAGIAPAVAEALTAAIQRLMTAVPLVGLNSADFLVDGERWWLLEINPRPGATLDIFETEGDSLFARHAEACRGALPTRRARHAGARASAIVYAEQDIAVGALDWPDWTADRPHRGTAVQAGEPLCTVFADAATADQARHLVARRGEAILSSLCARAA